MIPRFKSPTGFRDLVAIASVWQTDSVAEFEHQFAKLAGQKHAVAFPYGRTALTLLLKQLSPVRSEVICPAYTCVVVPHAIEYSGNTPVFVDCARGEYLMDLDLVEEAITPKTSAIIATSFYGYPVDLDRLARLSEKYPHVQIIQDCAHSFFASWKGQPVNHAGIAAIYGLNISKLLTSIFGGMLTTDNDQLADDMRQMRDSQLQPSRALRQVMRGAYLTASMIAFNPSVYGAVKWLQNHGMLDRFVRYFDEAKIDMPSDYLTHLSPLEARVGLNQLQYYQGGVQRRRDMAALYSRELGDCSALTLPPLVEGATYSHYVPRTERACELIAACSRRGVELGTVVEYLIPDLSAYQNHRFIDRDVGRSYVGQVLNLPLHQGVSDKKARAIIKLVKEFK